LEEISAGNVQTFSEPKGSVDPTAPAVTAEGNVANPYQAVIERNAQVFAERKQTDDAAVCRVNHSSRIFIVNYRKP
jgi:hypothetical protein